MAHEVTKYCNVTVEALLEIDRRLSTLGLDDAYAFYESVHHASTLLVGADAFYFCVYLPESDTLSFPYNFDGEVYDGPNNLPLSHGPSSWVIRNNSPYRATQENRELQDGGASFGDTNRISLSAIHAPIRRPGDGCATVLGVISAQSYLEGVYDDMSVRLLQWLADRAGQILWRMQECDAWTRRLAQATALQEDQRRQVREMSTSFINLIQDVSRNADNLRDLLPHDSHELHEAFRLLSRSCNRAQTEALQQPHFTPSPFPTPVPPSQSPYPPLTPQERDVLRLLTEGLKYGEIALRLHISVHTVKFHCNKIFTKLQVTTRAQAARAVTIQPSLLS